MRSIVCILLAVPALLLASTMEPLTVLPVEGPVDLSQPLTTPGPNLPTDGGGFVIGIVDTIGGTTYDWQSNGPAYRHLVNSPGFGIHATWMYSASDETTFPDRNMRYNYYDHSVGAWNWVDPDFMASGVNTFTERCGFGNMDADPSTGVAEVSAHLGSPIHPEIARDMAPGAGIFEYCSGSPTVETYQWPYIAAGQNGTIHCGIIDEATTDALFYTQVNPWCTWSTPMSFPAPQPEPMFPDQNVAASKVSDKVTVTWVNSPDGYSQKPGFQRTSTDGGASWGSATEILWPEAYGTDTLTSFHITSLFPFYGRDDDLHYVVAVAPYVRDTNYILPAEIWHWNGANTPNWNQIHRGSEVIEWAIGYNAIMSCRPSLGEDDDGNLFVAWEEFDGINYEPGPPERLRADIYWSNSADNGVNWMDAEKITDGGTVTHRFPSILDYLTDTVAVSYMIDQHAGFYLYAEGPATNNPIVVQKWANPLIGVKEGGRIEPLAMEVSATPNPFRRTSRLSYAVPTAGEVSLSVYDITGQSVAELVSGRKLAGRYSVNWNPDSELAAGVYLYQYIHDDRKLSGKLLLTE